MVGLLMIGSSAGELGGRPGDTIATRTRTMPTVHQREAIERAAAGLDLLPALEAGFAAYSRGEVVVPPVGELLFEDPPGDTHIKYGYIRGDEVFVVKIASGFYENPARGLAASSGCMLVFSQETGHLRSVLLDEGHLTDLRTAAAGAIAAKFLAPDGPDAIGVLGTGTQARLQVEALQRVRPCTRVVAWGRSPASLDRYAGAMEPRGYEVVRADTPAEVARACRLIVTCTPAEEPLLTREMIRPGTHITAVGSDTPGKQELDAAILPAADVVVGDSLSQCELRGEIHRAIRAGVFSIDRALELGHVIAEPSKGRATAEQITVADLTGVAVQDIQIAKAVAAALE
jgi:ornithine cyclodeaminase